MQKLDMQIFKLLKSFGFNHDAIYDILDQLSPQEIDLVNAKKV